jgi:sporulation protein YlmC with PRC-barrel domain
MLKMHLAAGIAAATLLTTPAVAQTSAPTVPAGQGQIMTQMPQDLMRGSKLMGIDVYGADNQKIGDIDEVLVDRQGKIQALVVGVGGFLGIGQKDVAIPYDQVHWMSNQELQAQNNQGGSGGASGSNTAAGGGGRAGGGDATATTGSTSGAGAAGSGGSSAGRAGGMTAGAGGTGSAVGGTSSGDANMPARATVRMTKADLQNAPEFRYSTRQGNQAGSGDAGRASGGAGASGTGGASGATGGATAPRQ